MVFPFSLFSPVLYTQATDLIVGMTMFVGDQPTISPIIYVFTFLQLLANVKDTFASAIEDKDYIKLGLKPINYNPF